MELSSNSKDFKENQSFFFKKQICNVLMVTCQTIVLPAANGSATQKFSLKQVPLQHRLVQFF
jgi:hypothetical protein